ncbi:MAG: ABC transporter permease [Acidobacteria bacterium]|nr:ABC transporter permease [Acidobacteriota bacterium]
MKDVFRQVGRDMRSQKLRTFLTVFGIVWGTVAISLLLAFGTGMHKQMIKNTAGLGDRIIIGWPGLTSMPYEGLGKGRRIRLSEEDIDHARLETKGLRAISSEYSNNMRIVYGTKTMAVDISGVSPVFGEMRNMIPDWGGRFINDLDMEHNRRTAFIGNQLKKDLFGEDDAIGKLVLVNGSPFQIVGVLKEKSQDSSYSGRDHSKMMIPSTTYRALTGEKYVDNFIAQPVRGTDSKIVMDSLRAAMSERQRFSPEDKEALSFWDTTEQFKFFDLFMLSFNTFLGIIGCLTLIVGGIGVSNIMNVVVEERTREIGIKMALGARQKSIMTQFLIETMIVTGIGGAIGFAISITICAFFPEQAVEFVGMPRVSPLVALLTASALGIVGLVAGYFPAREASRLDPVVAMKL